MGQASKLKNGWYILLYHDVSWEETPFVRHIGGTCPPDIFKDQVRICEKLGALVSVDEGMTRIRRGDVDRPLISFWFDDGMAGVRKHAAPVLDEHGVTGTTSICSRFIERREMFWRFQLSCLYALDGGECLRQMLRSFGYLDGLLIRSFTLDNFSNALVVAIDELYRTAVNTEARRDAFRLFETPDGILRLKNAGWSIANHSAAHYPIGEKKTLDITLEQFQECEHFISELTGSQSDHWVFPFDRKVEDTAIQSVFRLGKCPVLVRDRMNLPSNNGAASALTRINAPATNRDEVAHVLTQASRQA